MHALHAFSADSVKGAHRILPTAYYTRIKYCVYAIRTLQLTFYVTSFINFVDVLFILINF